MKTTKREKRTTEVGNYVRNSDLLPAVIEAKAKGEVTELLIQKIRMIAERYSRKFCFINYSFREDMVAVAVLNLCNNALKFNLDKGNNPFSFYTTAIHRSFLQYISDEKRHRNIRDALLVDAGSNPSFNYLLAERDEAHFELKESDDIEVPEPDIERALGELFTEEHEPVGSMTPITAPEDRIRYKGRAPGPVVTYDPADVEIDPVTFKITIKEKPKATVTEILPPLTRAQKRAMSEKLEETLADELAAAETEE